MPSDAPTPLERLSALGQSVWVDFLSRDSIHGGHLQELIDDYSVVGATSNPSIFQKAMTAGDAYDEQIHELADRDRSARPTSRRRSGRSPSRTSATRAICSARCGTAAAAATATSRSRSIRGWPTTRCETFREAMRLHERSTGPT